MVLSLAVIKFRWHVHKALAIFSNRSYTTISIGKNCLHVPFSDRSMTQHHEQAIIKKNLNLIPVFIYWSLFQAASHSAN